MLNVSRRLATSAISSAIFKLRGWFSPNSLSVLLVIWIPCMLTLAILLENSLTLSLASTISPTFFYISLMTAPLPRLMLLILHRIIPSRFPAFQWKETWNGLTLEIQPPFSRRRHYSLAQAALPKVLPSSTCPTRSPFYKIIATSPHPLSTRLAIFYPPHPSRIRLLYPPKSTSPLHPLRPPQRIPSRHGAPLAGSKYPVGKIVTVIF
ncbi:hypothetical protein V8E53_009208 [Lactarius tabidus]